MQTDEFSALLEPLRTGAWVISAIAGLTGASAVIYRGWERTPIVLMALFLCWAISPFAALIWANPATRAWPPLNRVLVYCTACFTSIGASIVLGYAALGTRGIASTRLFLLVPAGCWLFVGLALFLGHRAARRL